VALASFLVFAFALLIEGRSGRRKPIERGIWRIESVIAPMISSSKPDRP
jgi:hypothetical protein